MPTRTSSVSETDVPLGLSTRLARILAVVVALAMILFWFWILTGGPKKMNEDRLSDRAYVERTNDRCGVLLEELAKLPGAGEFTSASHRADVLDQANALVGTMVDDIEADAPADGGDREVLDKWFADWRTYLADREDYARRLRSDPDAKLLVTENPELHDSVDRTIEIFADVNEMADCATPGDVG